MVRRAPTLVPNRGVSSKSNLVPQLSSCGKGNISGRGMVKEIKNGNGNLNFHFGCSTTKTGKRYGVGSEQAETFGIIEPHTIKEHTGNDMNISQLRNQHRDSKMNLMLVETTRPIMVSTFPPILSAPVNVGCSSGLNIGLRHLTPMVRVHRLSS